MPLLLNCGQLRDTDADICVYLGSFVLPWQCSFSHLHPLDDRDAISLTEGWQVLPPVLSRCHPWAVTSLFETPPPMIFTDGLLFNPRSLTHPTIYYTALYFLSHTPRPRVCNPHSWLAINQVKLIYSFFSTQTLSGKIFQFYFLSTFHHYTTHTYGKRRNQPQGNKRLWRQMGLCLNASTAKQILDKWNYSNVAWTTTVWWLARLHIA